MILERLPQLRRITKLSPTIYSILKKCPLQAGLRTVNAQRTTVPSKAALLGQIAHGVLEKVSSFDGIVPLLRSQAEAVWDALVKKQEEKLKKLPLARHLIPMKRWKNYFLLRERTVRKCEKIVHSRGGSDTKIVSIERNLNNTAHGLSGRPDLILRRSEGMVIIDYKSSILPQDNSARQEKIEQWRIQVLFYAAIVHEEYGEWPVMGEIRMLNQERVRIPIIPSASIDVTKEASALMSDYNAKIDAGFMHSKLARYSPKICAVCDFKGNCETFWKEKPKINLDVDDYGCLSGTIKQISWTKNGVGSLIIDSHWLNNSSQRWEITNLSLPQFEYLMGLTQGDFVILLDFSIAPDISYRAKPTSVSVVWKLPCD